MARLITDVKNSDIVLASPFAEEEVFAVVVVVVGVNKGDTDAGDGGVTVAGVDAGESTTDVDVADRGVVAVAVELPLLLVVPLLFR